MALTPTLKVYHDSEVKAWVWQIDFPGPKGREAVLWSEGFYRRSGDAKRVGRQWAKRLGISLSEGAA